MCPENPPITSLFTSISDTTTMVHVHTSIQFKPGTEALEMKKRKAIRRQNCITQLKHIATRLARKKRIQRTSKFTLNQIARKLQKEVSKLDRRDQELWEAYRTYYQKGHMKSLMILKQTNNTVDLLSAHIGRTRRFNYWLAAVKMSNKVRVSLDRYERWLHPQEINSQLRAYLALMTRFQTKTTALWIKLQVKDKLEDKLRKMFWGY